MGWIHKRLIPGERRAHAANKRSRGRGGERKAGGKGGAQFITCKWYVGNCTLEKHIQALLGNIPVSKCCLQTYFSIMVILSKKQLLYCIVNKNYHALIIALLSCVFCCRKNSDKWCVMSRYRLDFTVSYFSVDRELQYTGVKCVLQGTLSKAL